MHPGLRSLGLNGDWVRKISLTQRRSESEAFVNASITEFVIRSLPFFMVRMRGDKCSLRTKNDSKIREKSSSYKIEEANYVVVFSISFYSQVDWAIKFIDWISAEE